MRALFIYEESCRWFLTAFQEFKKLDQIVFKQEGEEDFAQYYKTLFG